MSSRPQTNAIGREPSFNVLIGWQAQVLGVSDGNANVDLYMNKISAGYNNTHWTLQ